ncbi:MAG: SdrD B-like domain-containing protein, partial [Bacteroidota bacterium]
SNPISVTRLTGPDCQDPCVVDAGKLMVDPSIGDDCLKQGESIQITAAPVPGNDPVVPDGFSVIYVLTKGDDLVIQGAGPDPVFNILEAGKFTIHTLVYDPATLDLGVITFGSTTGAGVLALIEAEKICAALDVAGAMYTIKDCPVCDLEAGEISTDDNTNICADDGIADPITVTVSGTSAGVQSAWVITDEAGKILALPAGPPFDLEGAGAGTCLIWYLVHDGSLTGAMVGNNATTDLGGCFDLSNSIAVVRDTDCGDKCEADGGTISTDDPTTICVDGVGDPINVTVTGSKGANAAWVITDADLNILALPAGPPFDLDGAGPGVCLIWYLRWDGDISGAEVGKNAGDLAGECFDLSNAIEVTRNESPSITDATVKASDECVDGGSNGSATIFVSGGTEPYTYAWSNGGTMATIDGLAPGSYTGTVTDANGCSTSGTVEVGSMNSGVCVGDYVWLDGDRDGTQGQYENGVEGVEVLLIQAGSDGMYCTDDDVVVASTKTDAEGLYEFCCVTPGEYSILFDPVSLPVDFIFTTTDAGGDDEKDSDADPVSGKTPAFTITDGQMDDFSFDAGIRRVCINIENGGEIGEDQTICPGATPDKICATTLPSGGAGNIEYLWMFSTSDGPFDPNTWTMVENSNMECYDPGPLFETTYFILCSRRAGCDAYTGESNIVTITVNDCRRGFVDFDASV